MSVVSIFTCSPLCVLVRSESVSSIIEIFSRNSRSSRGFLGLRDRCVPIDIDVFLFAWGHEGNYSMTNILAGEREKEKAQR